jgi:hypothetical protein
MGTDRRSWLLTVVPTRQAGTSRSTRRAGYGQAVSELASEAPDRRQELGLAKLMTHVWATTPSTPLTTAPRCCGGVHVALVERRRRWMGS